jgi:hypothetical protein
MVKSVLRAKNKEGILLYHTQDNYKTEMPSLLGRTIINKSHKRCYPKLSA